MPSPNCFRSRPRSLQRGLGAAPNFAPEKWTCEGAKLHFCYEKNGGGRGEFFSALDPANQPLGHVASRGSRPAGFCCSPAIERLKILQMAHGVCLRAIAATFSSCSLHSRCVLVESW